MDNLLPSPEFERFFTFAISKGKDNILRLSSLSFGPPYNVELAADCRPELFCEILNNLIKDINNKHEEGVK
jgi:hypothetical protein